MLSEEPRVSASSPKTSAGNFFEDFRLGQQIRHATPRTITVGDVALYTALSVSPAFTAARKRQSA